MNELEPRPGSDPEDNPSIRGRVIGVLLGGVLAAAGVTVAFALSGGDKHPSSPDTNRPAPLPTHTEPAPESSGLSKPPVTVYNGDQVTVIKAY